MDKGQQFLLIRYGNNIVPEVVEKHQKIIDKLGYCWFGKIGVVPSQKIINAVLSEKNPRIILYTRGKAHECNVLDISMQKPMDGCPEYYETEGVIPSVYFKLSSIKLLDLNVLDQYKVISSGRSLSDAIWHSMTSYFFAEYPDGSVKKGKERTTSTEKVLQRVLLDKNDCVYKKDGICTCKSCINYKYECERPSMCLKQKR